MTGANVCLVIPHDIILCIPPVMAGCANILPLSYHLHLQVRAKNKDGESVWYGKQGKYDINSSCLRAVLGGGIRTRDTLQSRRSRALPTGQLSWLLGVPIYNTTHTCTQQMKPATYIQSSRLGTEDWDGRQCGGHTAVHQIHENKHNLVVSAPVAQVHVVTSFTSHQLRKQTSFEKYLYWPSAYPHTSL